MFCLVSQPAAEKNSGETAEMPAEKNGGETAELMDRGLGSRPLARCALGICLVALAVWPAAAQDRIRRWLSPASSATRFVGKPPSLCPEE